MTQARDDRRLMAIPFTDIAGYTTLNERGVNVAARVRPLAEPGDIAISESV